MLDGHLADRDWVMGRDYGIADIATLGAAGNMMESIGYKPEEAKQIIAGWQTDALRIAKEKVGAAKGFVPTVQAMVENPSTLYGRVTLVTDKVKSLAA